MAKMWAGRFSKSTAKEVDSFNTSLPFDCRMYKHDIQGSIAHATMLEKQGIITSEDLKSILGGLQSILSDIESGNLSLQADCEDIHMFVEEELTKRVGQAGKKLHTARSRNDQVALDMRLYVKDEIVEIKALIKNLLACLCSLAKKNLDTYMPGYTHLQRAQPITFAHWCMAYANMLKGCKAFK